MVTNLKTFLYCLQNVQIQRVLSEGVQPSYSVFFYIYIYIFLFYFNFLVDEEKEDLNTTKSQSSSAHQRNAIYMAFCWWADGGPTSNAGLVAL